MKLSGAPSPGLFEGRVDRCEPILEVGASPFTTATIVFRLRSNRIRWRLRQIRPSLPHCGGQELNGRESDCLKSVHAWLIERCRFAKVDRYEYRNLALVLKN